jgi:hypothetical protein
MLGRTEVHGGNVIVNAQFQRAAEQAARTILSDLAEHVCALAETLYVAQIMEEAALQRAVGGSQRGSHEHLLDLLRAAPGSGRS